MRKLAGLVALAALALCAGCGPKLTEEEQTAPPPAGPETYQAPPAGATGPGAPAPPSSGSEADDAG